MTFDFTDYINGNISSQQIKINLGYPKRCSINKIFKELNLYDEYIKARAKRRVNSTKYTFQRKYNVDNVFQTDWCKDKIKQTCIYKHGVEHVSQSPDFKHKIDYKLSNKKAKATFINNVELYAQKHNLIRVSELIKLYGQGWLKYFNPEIIMYHHRKLVDNKYIILAKDYYEFKQSNRSRSYCEQEIIDYIRTLYNGQILTNKRSIIKPYELDIYLPELKLAFEENDMFWHTNENPFSRIEDYDKYHKVKKAKCKQFGINLVVIERKEWLTNKSNICNIIKNLTKY